MSFYIFKALSPRTLYPRLENVEYDEFYSYNSNYGDVFTTLTTIYPWNLPMSKPDDYAWTESYHLKTLIHYYNITQDPELFFNIVNRCEIIVNNSDRNNDGIPGFGTTYYTEPNYVEYIVWDGMICQPIAQTARLIKSNASLFSIYNENYTKFLDLCERVVQKLNSTKWYEFNGKYGYYGYYVDGPGDLKIYNRINSIGNLFYELFMITGNQTYRMMIEKIGNFMKMALEPNKYKINNIQRIMYVWPYSEYIPSPEWGDKSDVSDTSHASIDVEFIVNCHNLGLCFDVADMEALANTFFDFIFRGFNVEKYYADRVDGFVGDSNYYLNILEGYAKLHKFYRDPDLGLYIVKRVNQKMVDDGWIYAVGTTRILSYLLEIERNNVWY